MTIVPHSLPSSTLVVIYGGPTSARSLLPHLHLKSAILLWAFSLPFAFLFLRSFLYASEPPFNYKLLFTVNLPAPFLSYCKVNIFPKERSLLNPRKDATSFLMPHDPWAWEVLLTFSTFLNPISNPLVSHPLAKPPSPLKLLSSGFFEQLANTY